MKQAHICIDARMLGHSGIGTYLNNIIPSLSNAAFRTTLIVHPKHKVQFSWLSEFECIESQATIYSIKEQYEVVTKMPYCDVMWTPHFNVSYFPFKAKKRLSTIHDLYHLRFSSSLPLLQRAYAYLFYSKAIKKADAVITMSQFSLSEIHSFFPNIKTPLYVIPSGVNTKLFSPRKNPGAFAQIQQKYQLPSSKKYFLFVGNVKPNKNLKTLLRAFVDFHKAQPEYALVIVGKKENFLTGESLTDLREIIRGIEEHVIFTGYVDNEDLPIIYSNATSFVFPSLYEGLGLPPLEAMATGCPVIASIAASIPEVCGSAALFFDPHNPQAIVQKMHEIVSSPSLREELIVKGNQRVQEFTWDKSIRSHHQVIESLLN